MKIEKEVGLKIRIVRIYHKDSQSDLAIKMGVTSQYISLIEKLTKTPSETFVRLFCKEYDLDFYKFINDGSLKHITEKSDKFFKKAGVSIMALGILSPLSPTIISGLLLGISAKTIIYNMRLAFKTDNDSKLAEILGVSPNAIYNWKSRNSVPETQIIKALKLSGTPIESFLYDMPLLENLIIQIEMILKNNSVELEPEKKAKLICKFFSDYSSSGNSDVNLSENEVLSYVSI